MEGGWGNHISGEGSCSLPCPQVMEAEESRTLPGGVVTTAEPRPNAYIPSGEADLPLPKPYGSHAPFKPTQPGSNIRHIRKPEPKPIDI